MRLKFTVFLLALNIIAFGLIHFLSKRAEQTDPRMGGLSGQIGREIIEADRIELCGQGLETPFVITRTGSTWNISEPMQWSANYFAVNRILNQLQFLEEEASFSVDEIQKTGQSLEDYGLQDPLIELTIAEGDDAIKLRIGTFTEIGNNIYLLGPNEEDIYVVSQQVIGGLLIELADLRTREIFDIPVFEVEALSLQIKAPGSAGNGELKVRLARTANAWNFEAPLSAEANPALVSNTINTLTAAKVGRFIEREAIDPILQGLESPFMRVTIQGNKRRQTLLVGNLDNASPDRPTYFAKLENNPTVFTVDATAFDELREAQEALRERNFMTFSPETLTAINISEGDRQIRLQRIETGDWQVIESNQGDNVQPYRADPAIMDLLIKDLSTLRATGFAIDSPSTTDLERLGFNKSRRSITLTGGENEVAHTLQLAHPETENDKLYARTDGKEFIYLVERRTTLDLLPLNASAYRNRTLDSLPEAAIITSIKLENITTGEIEFDHKLEENSQLWAEALVDVEQNEREQIIQLVEGIRTFRVKSYLKSDYNETGYPADKETNIAWAHRLSATISLPGGDIQQTDTRSYTFTKRLSGSVQIGGSALHSSMFEITQPMLDALHELTDSMIIPPELEGEPVKAPVTVQPVSEPQPISPDQE